MIKKSLLFLFIASCSYAADQGAGPDKAEDVIIIPEDAIESGRIKEDAFQRKAFNSKVVIPGSVKVIGKGAFQWAVFQRGVFIPNCVRVIEEEAFWGATLEAVTIPGSVKTVGARAFCPVQIDDLESLEGDYSGDGVKELTLEEGIEEIEEWAFAGVSIVRVTIPSSVKHLGFAAFGACRDLEEVTFAVKGNQKITINGQTFTHCSRLKNVSFEGGDLEFEGSWDNDSCTPDLSKCTKISFFGRDGLIQLDTNDPENVNRFLSKLIWYGRNGTTIKLPGGTWTCNGEEWESAFPPSNSPAAAQGVQNKAREVTVIPADAIESGRIKEDAFRGATIVNGVIPNGVKVIGKEAFQGAVFPKGVLIPDGVEVIEDGAFYDATVYETQVRIPSSVKLIGPNAFARSKLLGLVFNEGSKLERIERNAFFGTGLEGRLDIPNGVTEIGARAFGGTALECVTIPGSVIHVGERAFAPNWQPGAIIVVAANPMGDGNGVAARGDGNGVAARDDVPYPRKITRDGHGISQNIYLNEGLKTIGDHAFAYAAVEEVTIPGTVKVLVEPVFYRCYRLKTVTFKKGGTLLLGRDAFFECEGLQSLNFEGGNIIFCTHNTPWRRDNSMKVDLSKCDNLYIGNGQNNEQINLNDPGHVAWFLRLNTQRISRTPTIGVQNKSQQIYRSLLSILAEVKIF
ncbi:MAG: leucine-rich repeat domain-containing protein [Holosporales bacterium]|jgi:hypothetical protein|nr:leucine-rich repeat domain-containing protein [Holosporales bacterium]